MVVATLGSAEDQRLDAPPPSPVVSERRKKISQQKNGEIDGDKMPISFESLSEVHFGKSDGNSAQSSQIHNELLRRATLSSLGRTQSTPDVSVSFVNGSMQAHGIRDTISNSKVDLTLTLAASIMFHPLFFFHRAFLPRLMNTHLLLLNPILPLQVS